MNEIFVMKTVAGAIIFMAIVTTVSMVFKQPALATMGVGVGILLTITSAFIVLYRKIEKLQK